ncbi:phosphonate ABC transporter, permease protein PhnE, partial [Acinetobacter baumannii]
LSAMWPPSSGGETARLLYVILQTLAMAALGTSMATVLAVPVGILAARNLVTNPVIHFAVRRVLDMLRGIPVLVWALIMVA